MNFITDYRELFNDNGNLNIDSRGVRESNTLQD